MIQNWGQDGFGVHVVSFLLLQFWETWASLAWRTDVCNQRLCLFYNFLNNIIDVNIDELGIHLLKDSDSRKTRGYHPNKIVRQHASDKNSPLWTSTLFRTTPQWNNLSPASLEAGSITIFKSQLSPDRSVHLPTSTLCLVWGDWVWFSTQSTSGLLNWKGDRPQLLRFQIICYIHDIVTTLKQI